MKRINCHFFLTCTVLFVLGCGQTRPTPEDSNQIQFLIGNLAVQRGQRWVYTCRRLIEEYGDLAVEPLIENLGSTDANIRRGCAYCLGHIGDKEAIEPLAHHLGDPDLFVRLEAAASLCMLGRYDGVPLLIVALRHEESALVRGAAYQTLRQVVDENFGYDHQATAEQREPAVQRYEAWWQTNQSRFLE